MTISPEGWLARLTRDGARPWGTGLAAELTVDFALSQGVDDADAALELVIRFLREQGRARAELHRVAAMEPKGRA